MLGGIPDWSGVIPDGLLESREAATPIVRCSRFTNDEPLGTRAFVPGQVSTTKLHILTQPFKHTVIIVLHFRCSSELLDPVPLVPLTISIYKLNWSYLVLLRAAKEFLGYLCHRTLQHHDSISRCLQQFFFNYRLDLCPKHGEQLIV